jgi:5-methylcytosine-specific restriction endonuclease McrA
MYGQTNLPLILGLDIAGRPVDWLSWQDAVCLKVREQVAWTAGSETFLLRGGVRNFDGERSYVEINSIMAIRNARAYFRDHVTPVLTNAQLFRRDRFMCMYCGETHSTSCLTRDHVIPQSRGGLDIWGNVVTACRPCNLLKGSQTPEEAGMPLLALPYAPSRAEALILQNRRILADQAEFLTAHVKRKSTMQ